MTELDSKRLTWLIEKSSFMHDKEPIVLIVTEQAVKTCAGTWRPEYQNEVRRFIDKEIQKSANPVTPSTK